MDRFSLGHPALNRAVHLLAEEAPVAASQAAASLNFLLEGVTSSSWQEIAWSFSRLTGDGFPLEFSFSSADEAIRYTVEVAGPELAEVLRLDHAEQCLRHLEETSGGYQISPEVSTMLHAVQMNGSLCYGAWLAARHSVHEQSYKLYVEVPEQSSEVQLIDRLVGSRPLLCDRIVQLRMIGYEPCSARTELYFRADGMEPWEVKVLLQRFGIEDREEELFSLIEAAYGRSARSIMPATRVGFSVSIAANGGPTVFSLFTFARSIFGSDGNIRRGMLKLAEHRGWNLRSYERLSEPLINERSWRTRHGMLAFVLVPKGPPMVHIGLRPPESV